MDHGEHGFTRNERVAGQLRREIAQLIWSEIQDPRLGPVTVTDVEVSRDLSHAKVFVATSRTETIKDSLKALRHAAGFLRRRLGQQMRLRSVPELHFEHDDSAERGERIDQLLAEARRSDDAHRPLDSGDEEDE